MMDEVDAIIIGRGGQGTKLAAQVITHAAALDGYSPLHYSVYDGLIRGGNIASTVVLARDQPGVPIRSTFGVVVALHSGWFDRYFPRLISGGHVFYESSALQTVLATRDDVNKHFVAFSGLSRDSGDPRAANMVAAGVLCGHWRAPNLATLEAAVREVVPAHRQDRVAANIAALRAGWAFAARDGDGPA
jgi:2-oxoglutarate ferredoxin oxidoreductase subunit gamma